MNAELEKAQDLWEAVRAAPDPENMRVRMIELSGLLLKQAAPGTDEIGKLSGSDLLTDYFIEFLNAGETVQTFFQQALGHLEEELKGGEFEAQVRETADGLDKTAGRLNDLKAANKELLAQKERLVSESETLRALETELDTLKHLEAGLRPENLAALSEELRRLSEQTEKLLPEKERLETELGELEPACRQMAETVESLESEKTRTTDRMVELSKHLTGLLDGAWEEYDTRLAEELNTLTQKNRSFLEIAGKLDACEKEVREAVAAEKTNVYLFETHFSANNDALRASEGSPHPDDSVRKQLNRVNTLSGEIAGKLAEFDRALGDILTDVEEKVNRIRRLNRTG